VTEGDLEDHIDGRLYSSFNTALVLDALGPTAAVVHQEDMANESSGQRCPLCGEDRLQHSRCGLRTRLLFNDVIYGQGLGDWGNDRACALTFAGHAALTERDGATCDMILIGTL
jgi:hypothetical protein